MVNFKGVLPGSIVAVSLSGNYKPPPHLAKFIQVTETFFNVQRLKGSYKRKWMPWCGWSSTQLQR